MGRQAANNPLSRDKGWRVLISALTILFFTVLVGVLFWLAERPVKKMAHGWTTPRIHSHRHATVSRRVEHHRRQGNRTVP
jgi:hypothetical protein